MSKYLSRLALENIAGNLVRRYYKSVPQNGPLPPPVDPLEMATNIFGLEVSYLPLSTDGSVLGMACFMETEIKLVGRDGSAEQIRLSGRDIVIDDALLEESKTGRRNFTAAHELAHHVLVRLYPEDYRGLLNCRTHILYRRRSQSKNWVEWQADTMGAAILMPPLLIRLCMDAFGLGGKLDMLSSVCRPKEYCIFCDIASYLGVSKKALAIRMTQLGLLGKDYLENPAEPLNVWMEEGEFDG